VDGTVGIPDVGAPVLLTTSRDRGSVTDTAAPLL